jgi:cytochrome c553
MHRFPGSPWLHLCAALAAVAVCPKPALAAEPSRTLAASCAGCHGTLGQGAGAMPAIAGLPERHLSDALRQFRAGERPATVMQQLARGYSDEEIQHLAAHFARLPRAAR